ncbi:acyl-CoA N-acyltransferase [Zychaea mexicana]|uniref:acyl-CoA N-acyltransferase n=1 Tax=Zychaea mexicana TaxID=64656 RepID=UPI0022FE91D6|nr:acyl-CoA N-acyltransferase [Zychaea mexicana]KAI9489987.1 acyl-CoA N-acyltransferase [Zychaea mexicana]
MVVAQYANPEIRPALTDEDKHKCIDVRVKVFVDEQKYPLESEIDDEYNAIAYNWLATCDVANTKERIPIGTIRLIPGKEGVAKLGRLAVLSNARGMSLGRKLVLAFLEGAKEQGYKSAVLEAQIDKRIFYEKLGFVVEKGDEEPYPVDGTPHLKMWMRSLS